MEIYFQGILTIISLVNPMICAQIFNSIEKGKKHEEKLKDLTETIFTVGIILSLSAFLGSKILHLLGISLDAFQVAGGIVLVSIGFQMLNKKEKNNENSEKEKSLTPLVLFAASPGTITGVITLSITQSENSIPIVALISIAVVLIIMWVIIALMSKRSSKRNSKSSQLATRFMGLIILAMGIEFILTGVTTFCETFTIH
ncbi:MarC family protein [Flammeovirga pacifica]|uniref:UPF0056 membrane protein n=1 Tax=Flammeovirga pacifica TaxID=915059 RepID=A0A1S1YTR8_FLAPC|nr:MarC family protein [Flammeovirga pacifica]OHX64195.1 hypothetical protein NH26_21565 [Flammeovirga pacifica]